MKIQNEIVVLIALLLWFLSFLPVFFGLVPSVFLFITLGIILIIFYKPLAKITFNITKSTSSLSLFNQSINVNSIAFILSGLLCIVVGLVSLIIENYL